MFRSSSPTTRKRHWGIQCGTCRMRLFSWYRHDFRNCFCGSVFVDGGFDYLRCGFEPGHPWTSVYWTQGDWAPEWYLEWYSKNVQERIQYAR